MGTLLNVFLLSLVAGLGTGLGGLIAVVQKPGRRRFGFFMGIAGGVMVFITLDELVPAAREYGHQHYTAMGIILGSIFVFLLSGVMGI
jgi:zinc transporter, ZIP family